MGAMGGAIELLEKGVVSNIAGRMGGAIFCGGGSEKPGVRLKQGTPHIGWERPENNLDNVHTARGYMKLACPLGLNPPLGAWYSSPPGGGLNTPLETTGLVIGNKGTGIWERAKGGRGGGNICSTIVVDWVTIVLARVAVVMDFSELSQAHFIDLFASVATCVLLTGTLPDLFV